MSQKVPHEKSLRGDIAVDPIVQSFGQLVPTRIGLGANVRHRSVAALNRMLAHTLLLRDLYKKSHWHTAGATFYQLHLLFDRHAERQTELADVLAERVQTLGGVSLALARDLAQESRLSRASRDREAATASCITCAMRTNSSSSRRGRWPGKPQKTETTAQTTYSSAR